MASWKHKHSLHPQKMQALWEERATRSAPKPGERNQRLISGPGLMKLMVSDSVGKLDHTSGGIVVPCSRGPSREKTSLPEETLGGTLPEVLAYILGDSSWEWADRPVCFPMGSKLPPQSQGPDSSVNLDVQDKTRRRPSRGRPSSGGPGLPYRQKSHLKLFPKPYVWRTKADTAPFTLIWFLLFCHSVTSPKGKLNKEFSFPQYISCTFLLSKES